MNHKPSIDEIRNGFHFRSICESDKAQFMSLRQEASEAPGMYKMDGFADYFWEQELESDDNIFMMVFRVTDGVFLSACSFQGINRESIELGYDVVREYRGQGIGTAIVEQLISLAHGLFPTKQIIVRINAENLASKRVTEKCGGKLLSLVDTQSSLYFQHFIDKYKDNPDFSGSFDFDEMQKIIDAGKNGVLLYEV